MTTKGKRPMRAMTPGDKIEAIQRVNDGESKASVARDIGVPESTLRGWCKNEDKLRYMTSRLSSPDTDKSSDCEPREKRARTDTPSPTAPTSPAVTNGLDLTTPTTSTHTTQQSPPVDTPVELTTKRLDPAPPTQHPPRERRLDPGANASMSAISPLSGFGHIPGLSHSRLGGLNFNDIATNLSLLAQLNPGLSALSAQPGSRALRSVRSPKPAHNGIPNLNDSKHRSKSHQSSDPYRSMNSSHHSIPTSAASQPIDESLWYWLHTQQAMLDFTAQTAARPLQIGKAMEHAPLPRPAVPTAPVTSHLDYNKNSILWQYYKQMGGAVPQPEDKLKSAAQVPKDKSFENILYSHLTKGRSDQERARTSSPPKSQQADEKATNVTNGEDKQVAAPVPSPAGAEVKEPVTEKNETAKSQTKARNVLDNLLFNAMVGNEEYSSGATNGEWVAGTDEALEHGEKFLAWLETSGHPSVTRVHLYQISSLLHNLRARRPSAAVPADNASARRK